MKLMIFLDTSVLPRNPARTPPEFDVLCELAQQDKVKVAMSEITRKEWVIQHLDEYESKIRKAYAEMDSLIRTPWMDETKFFASLKGVTESIAKSEASVSALVTSKCNSILERLKPEMVSIMEVHAREAFAKYFDGKPPFKGRKARKDLPDGFILESLKEVAQREADGVIAVIADDALASAASLIPRVTVIRSVADLIKLEPIVQAQHQLHFATAWQSWLKTHKGSLEQFNESVEEAIKSQNVNVLAGEHVTDYRIPDDSQAGHIDMVGDPESIEIDWDSADEYAVGIIAVPVNFECEVLLSFHVPRWDAFDVPECVFR